MITASRCFRLGSKTVYAFARLFLFEDFKNKSDFFRTPGEMPHLYRERCHISPGVQKESDLFLKSSNRNNRHGCDCNPAQNRWLASQNGLGWERVSSDISQCDLLFSYFRAVPSSHGGEELVSGFAHKRRSVEGPLPSALFVCSSSSSFFFLLFFFFFFFLFYFFFLFFFFLFCFCLYVFWLVFCCFCGVLLFLVLFVCLFYLFCFFVYFF